MFAFLNRQPFRVKLYFYSALILTFLLIALYVLFLAGLTDYNQSNKFNGLLLGLVSLFCAVVVADLLQSHSKIKKNLGFASFNVIWLFIVLIVCFANEIFWFSDPEKLLEHSKEKAQKKAQEMGGVDPEIILEGAYFTYNKWLLLQSISEDNTEELRSFYAKNAVTEVRVIDPDSVFTRNKKYTRDELAKNVLTYYVSNIRNGKLYPVVLLWQIPLNLEKAEPKASIGTPDEQHPYVLFEPDTQKRTVRVRGTYMIAIPENLEFRSDGFTITHDDVYIDMLISVNEQGKTQIIQDLWEYSINIPKFPSNPRSTLGILKKYLK